MHTSRDSLPHRVSAPQLPPAPLPTLLLGSVRILSAQDCSWLSSEAALKTPLILLDVGG